MAEQSLEFCAHCGGEVLRCIGCGHVIVKTKGWAIWMDLHGGGPPMGSYHDECLTLANSEARIQAGATA